MPQSSRHELIFASAAGAFASATGRPRKRSFAGILLSAIIAATSTPALAHDGKQLLVGLLILAGIGAGLFALVAFAFGSGKSTILAAAMVGAVAGFFGGPAVSRLASRTDPPPMSAEDAAFVQKLDTGKQAGLVDPSKPSEAKPRRPRPWRNEKNEASKRPAPTAEERRCFEDAKSRCDYQVERSYDHPSKFYDPECIREAKEACGLPPDRFRECEKKAKESCKQSVPWGDPDDLDDCVYYRTKNCAVTSGRGMSLASSGGSR